VLWNYDCLLASENGKYESERDQRTIETGRYPENDSLLAGASLARQFSRST